MLLFKSLEIIKQHPTWQPGCNWSSFTNEWTQVENESVRIKNRLRLSWHQVHSSDKNHPSTQKYSLIITITVRPILQCFTCINTGSSPLPFHNMFYQVHFTDREEAQKHFPAQIQASYPTAEPGFKPGSAVQPLNAYPAWYSEMSTSSSWLSPVTAWGVTAVWAWSPRLHTRRHIWLANLSQFLKIQWCEDYSKGILKLLHSLKADKALSNYSPYLHLLVLYEMIQNPIFLQYSANRPYKEKLDRKLPVDRGPVSPTDALSFHRPRRNNDRRQKAPSPGEASPLLRHAFKRLPSPCIAKASGKRLLWARRPHSPGAPAFLRFQWTRSLHEREPLDTRRSSGRASTFSSGCNAGLERSERKVRGFPVAPRSHALPLNGRANRQSQNDKAKIHSSCSPVDCADGLSKVGSPNWVTAHPLPAHSAPNPRKVQTQFKELCGTGTKRVCLNWTGLCPRAVTLELCYDCDQAKNFKNTDTWYTLPNILMY